MSCAASPVGTKYRLPGFQIRSTAQRRCRPRCNKGIACPWGRSSRPCKCILHGPYPSARSAAAAHFGKAKPKSMPADHRVVFIPAVGPVMDGACASPTCVRSGSLCALLVPLVIDPPFPFPIKRRDVIHCKVVPLSRRARLDRRHPGPAHKRPVRRGRRGPAAAPWQLVFVAVPLWNTNVPQIISSICINHVGGRTPPSSQLPAAPGSSASASSPSARRPARSPR